MQRGVCESRSLRAVCAPRVRRPRRRSQSARSSGESTVVHRPRANSRRFKRDLSSCAMSGSPSSASTDLRSSSRQRPNDSMRSRLEANVKRVTTDSPLWAAAHDLSSKVVVPVVPASLLPTRDMRVTRQFLVPDWTRDNSFSYAPETNWAGPLVDVAVLLAWLALPLRALRAALGNDPMTTKLPDLPADMPRPEPKEIDEKLSIELRHLQTTRCCGATRPARSGATTASTTSRTPPTSRTAGTRSCASSWARTGGASGGSKIEE